jgi:hypothetical protein
MFMKTTGALAAGVWTGVPPSGTAAQTALPRAARPENELTAGMIDFHVHTAPVHGELQIAEGFRNSPSRQLSTLDESDRAIRLNY